MISAPRRHVIALGALGGLMIAVVVQLGCTRSAPAGAPARASNAASSRNRGTTTQPPVSGIRLDLLEHSTGDYPAPERNPFKFEAPRTPQSASANAGRGRRAAPAPLPEPPPGPPPLPPIPWRFVGVAELPAGRGRAGAFSDGRGNTVWAKEGDIIDGRYRVLRVGADSADLAYLDGRGRQSLRLSGQ